jgi:hypothetical protein
MVYGQQPKNHKGNDINVVGVSKKYKQGHGKQDQ